MPSLQLQTPVPVSQRPGEHVPLLAGSPRGAALGWSKGWELRDTLLVMTPTATLYLFLFRIPLQESTIVENLLAVGVGGLSIDRGRVNGRWPPNVLLVHHSECRTECCLECPVFKLDQQSGVLKSGAVRPNQLRNNSRLATNGGYHGRFGDSFLIGYGDEGGASRFFPQFESLMHCIAWVSDLIATD